MNEKKPDKNSIGVLSWIINVILLSAFWPAGVTLLLMRLAGNDVISKLLMRLFTKAEERRNTASDHFAHFTPESRSSSQSRAAQQGYAQTQETQQQAWQAQQAQQQAQAQQQQAQQQAWQQQHRAQQAQQQAWQTQQQQAWQAQQRQQQAWAQPHQQQAPQAKPETNQVPENKKDPVARIGKGRTVLIIFGWLLLALGVLTMFEPLSAGALWRVLESLAVALGGGGMLYAAWKKNRKEQDYQNCVKIVGDKTNIDLDSLAAALGRKQKDVEKDLDDMVDRGYFGEAAYIDKARDVLIIDPAKAEVQLKKAADLSPEGKDQYQLLLMELDRCIQRIRDPGMQQKAMKIRGLSASIFAAVREEPAKRPKIGTFLNYYFPQTLKLLNSYGDIENKDYQGENLVKTRERIEGAADLLIDAYQRQLDALYLSTSMDVDSDIDVLETMLRRDGLSNSAFSALGEEEGQQQGGL